MSGALGRSTVQPQMGLTRASLPYCALAWFGSRIPAGDYITRVMLPHSGSMMQRLSS